MFIWVVLGAVASIARGAGLCETAPDFTWLNPGPVRAYAPTMLECGANLGIRRFRKEGQNYLLLVDPVKLKTRVALAACTPCKPAQDADWMDTPLLHALDTVLQTENGIENRGVRHALNSAQGYFLTVDLCPSRRPGFDEEIFTALEALKRQAGGLPVPVGISISGGWLRHHSDAFNWLKEQDAKGLLEITWINHTLTHPYSTHLALPHNFMLEAGVNLDREILGLEKLLLEHGALPSVFFRFPGLVANSRLVERLRGYYLLPIGSDAWLAKMQNPKNGSIVLIHGNENEPEGVKDFLQWLAHEETPPRFLPVSRAF